MASGFSLPSKRASVSFLSFSAKGFFFSSGRISARIPPARTAPTVIQTTTEILENAAEIF